jgi:hypothetical protein
MTYPRRTISAYLGQTWLRFQFSLLCTSRFRTFLPFSAMLGIHFEPKYAKIAVKTTICYGYAQIIHISTYCNKSPSTYTNGTSLSQERHFPACISRPVGGARNAHASSTASQSLALRQKWHVMSYCSTKSVAASECKNRCAFSRQCSVCETGCVFRSQCTEY